MTLPDPVISETPLPPEGLPGLDPAWSRSVQVVDGHGVDHTWHLLDTGPPVATEHRGTLLCVHGNPTWSYLWRGLLADPPPGWRVVAPDQLGMGYSDRLARPRTLAQRVDDLHRLTDTLGITGPVVTVAHDWGGAVSLGWAIDHPEQLRAVVLTNTAVHQPAGDAGPWVIRAAHLPGVRQLTCERTGGFVAATTALSRPALAAPVRQAFAAPYDSAARRTSVADFVADIPFAIDHPSRPELDRIADGVRGLDVPSLLLWGPRDPVFGEKYLRDLTQRLTSEAHRPDVHRYEGASHLVTEDAPRYAADIARWLADLDAPAAELPPATGHRPVWAALSDRARDPAVAIAEVGGMRIGWDQLHARVMDLSAGLTAAGVRAGDRVAMLVPPSVDLTAAVYAVWRAGAVVVVADKGLGVGGMGRALRGAHVDHVIGTAQGLAAARLMRLPGQRFLVGHAGPVRRRALGAAKALHHLNTGGPLAPVAGPDDECAVLFTSGATGPSKGVVYRHRQVRAQLDAISAAYSLSATDRLVAAFAPFAIYGPALGIGSAVPAADVTRPATLTAAALADAVAAISGTVVFASPAALRNVVATAQGVAPHQHQALAGVRLLMSAGAPVPDRLLQQVRRVLPGAVAHTPYGMTEALPVTDISLPQVLAAGRGNGICVGRPLTGVTVELSSVDQLGRADGARTSEPGVSGEICVRAGHVKDRYDALWATERAASRDAGWHRTGDVGHLDGQGRLWVEGRLPHVITTAAGPVTPVGIEQRIEALSRNGSAAIVGVGPVGNQQLVAVLATPRARRGSPVAEVALSDRVRRAAGHPLAAVLVRTELPVDIRHASKVDRSRLAGWAAGVLAGDG